LDLKKKSKERRPPNLQRYIALEMKKGLWDLILLVKGSQGYEEDHDQQKSLEKQKKRGKGGTRGDNGDSTVRIG